MTPAAFFSLALQTVTAPREVARLLLSTRLNQEALLTAFALVVVLNTLVFALTAQLAPAQSLQILGSPVAFMVMQAGALAGAIYTIAAIGRFMGGDADLTQIGTLMIWLQALRVLAQAGLLLVSVVATSLAAFLALGISILGVWIAVNFIDEAHELQSLFKSGAVLILGLVATAVGLSLVLSLFGITPQGVNGYV